MAAGWWPINHRPLTQKINTWKSTHYKRTTGPLRTCWWKTEVPGQQPSSHHLTDCPLVWTACQEPHSCSWSHPGKVPQGSLGPKMPGLIDFWQVTEDRQNWWGEKLYIMHTTKTLPPAHLVLPLVYASWVFQDWAQTCLHTQSSGCSLYFWEIRFPGLVGGLELRSPAVILLVS